MWPYYKVPFCGLKAGGGALSILPGGPNQAKAHETCLPSFLQSPLKNRYVSTPPWGRGNEDPKLHFALEHLAVLNKLMQFRGGPTPREGRVGERGEQRWGGKWVTIISRDFAHVGPSLLPRSPSPFMSDTKCRSGCLLLQKLTPKRQVLV